MEKWEYLMVYVDGYKIRRVNDQDLQNWKTTNVSAFLNQLGNDRWEMSGLFSPASELHYLLFFKRRKP
jgi:hypothetical protein